MKQLRIECRVGDIADQGDMDAVVNAAHAGLGPGGGVAGAPHRAAGPGLARECAPLAPIRPGQAVITGGHDLPNRFVIHCLGPVHGRDQPADRLLARCYHNALDLADRHRLRTVAMPALSTGAFGYPMAEAAAVAMAAVLEWAPRLQHVRELRWVLANEADRALHQAVLDAARA